MPKRPISISIICCALMIFSTVQFGLMMRGYESIDFTIKMHMIGLPRQMQSLLLTVNATMLLYTAMMIFARLKRGRNIFIFWHGFTLLFLFFINFDKSITNLLLLFFIISTFFLYRQKANIYFNSLVS